MATLDDVVSGAASAGGADDDGTVIADFSEAVEFEKVPAGKYAAVIKSVTPKKAGEKAKNPGAGMLDWCFAITEEGPFKNRLVFRNTMLAGKGAGFLKKMLKGIGEEEASKGEVTLTPASYAGRAVVIEVGDSNLEDRSEVKSVSLPKTTLG